MKNKGPFIVSFSLSCITCFLVERSRAQERGEYVGASGCTACHEALVQGWNTTPHAKAFESLKKSSQQSLPGCVKCHVTAYEQKGGFIDNDVTPEMAGVQCEECHGPGKRSAPSGGDKASIVRSGGSDLCTRCHTPGQDKNLSYGQERSLYTRKTLPASRQ